jgi:hypothetical protein
MAMGRAKAALVLAAQLREQLATLAKTRSQRHRLGENE